MKTKFEIEEEVKLIAQGSGLLWCYDSSDWVLCINEKNPISRLIRAVIRNYNLKDCIETTNSLMKSVYDLDVFCKQIIHLCYMVKIEKIKKGDRE